MGFREERVALNEVAARAVNESIQEIDSRPASSFIHVACECGLENCERVLAITMPVYERGFETTLASSSSALASHR